MQETGLRLPQYMHKKASVMLRENVEGEREFNMLLSSWSSWTLKQFYAHSHSSHMRFLWLKASAVLRDIRE